MVKILDSRIKSTSAYFLGIFLGRKSLIESMLLWMTYVLSTLKITEMHRRKLLASIRWRCEKAAWWRCLERVPPLRPCPHHREELSLEITFPSDYT